MKYYVEGTIGSGGYNLNIHFEYAIVSRTAYHLSCKWYHWIIRTVTKSNHIWCEWFQGCQIKWIHTKYSLSVGIDLFEGPLNINLVIL